MTRLGGADDAGRGCLIGPLVIGGVSIDERRSAELKDMGVRDSKALSAERREELYDQIVAKCSVVCSVAIPPKEIDRVVRAGVKYRRLNYLEAVYFARAIDRLRAGKVVVDASDSSPARFGRMISEKLARKCRIISRHKADRDYPVVSAASIVAKVERDRAVEQLRRKLGDFGSGYPSDPRTKSFFMEKLRKGEPLPPQVRSSWKSWENFRQTILAEH